MDQDDERRGVRGDESDPSRHNPVLSATVYQQLRAIAQNKLANERAGHTLQATALVHEAYLRLEKGKGTPPAATAEFYWAAAEAMRRILIEHARKKHAVKRGGSAQKVSWTFEIADVADLASSENAEHIEAIDAAIERLRVEDPRSADVVRLRFYAGLSLDEVARTLGISLRTAKRDWEYARAFLLRALQDGLNAGA